MILHKTIFCLVTLLFAVSALEKVSKNREVTVVRLSGSTEPLPKNATRRRLAGVVGKPGTALTRPRVSGFANYKSPGIGFGGKYGPLTSINGPGGRLQRKGIAAPVDFNPQLLSGLRGYPGIKLRVNRRGFQYATILARQIIDREIVRAHIPDVTQEVKEVNGQVTVCNIHISNYRPPNCVEIVPSPPNQITLRVGDFDVGATGNIDGIAMIFWPIKLFGIVHANFYHVSATVSLSIERGPNGAPYVKMCNCEMKIPYADVCIERGGLIGDLANALVRKDITKQVQKMVPEKVCKMLPEIIEQRINPMLQRIPQSIGFSQIASMFTALLGSNVPDYCYSPACKQAATTLPPPAPVAAALPPPANVDNALSSVSQSAPPNNPPSPSFNNNVASQTAAIAAPAAPTVDYEQTNTAVETPVQQPAVQVQQQQQPVQVQPAVQVQQQQQPVQVQQIGGAQQPTGAQQFTGQQALPYSEGRRRNVLFGSTIRRVILSSDTRRPGRVKRQNHLQQLFDGFSGFNQLQPLFPAIGSSLMAHVVASMLNPLPAVVPPPQQQQQQPNEQLSSPDDRRQHLGAQPGGALTLRLPPTSNRASEFRRLQSLGANGSGNITSLAHRKNTSLSLAHGVSLAGTRNYRAGVHGAGGRGNPCSACPPGASSDSFGAIKNLILRQLDMKKLADVLLTTQMTRAYATPNDYNIDLNGEFSPRGLGGTPFGPAPMSWPTLIGQPMVEAMISDYTLNSLLYVMHKRNFLSFRIGPQTPGIGPLLTTTCDDGSDYSAEDGGDGSGEILLSRLLRLRNRRRSRHHRLLLLRQKRQIGGSSSGSGGGGGGGLGDLGDLADLGICIGDIMPAVKEKYPNRTLAIVAHTARAPSIQLASRPNGDGQMTMNVMALADIYLDNTNVRVGTIAITAVADVLLHMVGNRLTGTATLPVLQLSDRDHTLGLEQDSLNNLASLAKGMLVKAANSQLQKGMALRTPSLGLPVDFVNPRIRVLNHAIYLGSDIAVSPTFLQSV